MEEQIKKKNRSYTWEQIKEHRQLCRTYAEAHKERCLTKKPSATLEETCSLAEQKLDLFNLMLIRKRIQLEVDRVKQSEETKKENTKKAGWFGGWFGGGKKDDNDDQVDLVSSIQAAMTPEEKKKLHKAIGYEDNMAPLQLPDYYEAVHMKFTLNSFEIGLYDDSDGPAAVDYHSLQTIMLLKLNTTTCVVKQRPGANAIRYICIQLGFLYQNVF